MPYTLAVLYQQLLEAAVEDPGSSQAHPMDSGGRGSSLLQSSVTHTLQHYGSDEKLKPERRRLVL